MVKILFISGLQTELRMIDSYLLVNELRVHYLHWRPHDGDQPVVLLHGLASNARIWELVAPRLAENGMRPIAVDARGHGLTDKPDGSYAIDVFGHDLFGFVDALDLEHPLLVGHSWGAMLVLDYATRYAFGPRSPLGIVLVDGGATQLDDVPGATWESMRERLAPPNLAGVALEDFLVRLKTVNANWQPDETAIQIILGNFEISADETIYPRLTFERHMQIVRTMWEFKTYEYYSQIRCPVLLVPARPAEPLPSRDQEYLEFKQRGIARILLMNHRIQVNWMKDTIHDIPLQRPGELADLIADFSRSCRLK